MVRSLDENLGSRGRPATGLQRQSGLFRDAKRSGLGGQNFVLIHEPLLLQFHRPNSETPQELPPQRPRAIPKRHGGCRRVFNEVAELSIAQQLLGNSDMKTTLVYAKRHAGALTKVVHGYWDRKAALLAARKKTKKKRPRCLQLLATGLLKTVNN